MRENDDFRRMLRSSLVAGISGVLICAGSPTLAQAATASSDEGQARASDGSQLGDIVVTAQRRSRAETAQRVPIAITAVSGRQLEEMHALTLTDVGRVAPNVSLTPSGTFPGTANFLIRGIGVNTSDPSAEPAVGVFVDGMYYGVNLGVVTDAFDLESVEILRGPQGTLFGRNVTGGAVVMRSRRPSGEFGLQGKVSYGNFNQISGAASVEGPLIKDVLNAKVAIMSNSNNGLFANAANPGNRIGRHNDLIVRPIMEFKPSDRLTLTLIGEIGRMDDYGTPSINVFNNAGAPIPSGKFILSSDFDAHSQQRWKHVILEGAYEVPNGTIKATLTARKIRTSFETDVDASSAQIFSFVAPTGLHQHQKSAEIIYNGKFGDYFELTAGGNYFQQMANYSEARSLNGGASRPVSDGILHQKTGGVFAQGDAHFGTVTITAGGRYTIDHKAVMTAALGGCSLDGTVCNYAFSNAHTWRDFTPKAGIRWQPTNALQFYFTYTKGFRGGGYGLRNSPGVLPGPYNPEKVDAYEVGAKSEWFDRRLRVNMALYRNTYDDLQRLVQDFNLVQRTLNAASARIQGAEIEIAAIPVRNLTLSGSVGYTDAKYLAFNNLDLTGDKVPDPLLAKRLLLSQAPKWNYNLTASYDVPIGDAGKLNFRGNYYHLGKRANDDLNKAILPSYGLLDASVSWSSADDRYKISVFGKNLANKLAYANGGTVSSTFESLPLLPPRRYGVEVSFKL
ncbi:TonB-dependent receptor [Rhizorhabdus wittichii RW1]|uniref:TonB-dependent receptor n=1 Tax=Rhizorhabdus wittichii (strain DSM 6014 / CCUG 31198 / JCM 15750 / NBRC 105917 / EY 4224 / RW1) TaxID=392499 RepID=A0A9J9HEY4_RHIWR|nr:TonB-dependent receptor [Rhizorhabdus wittichii RW1]